MERGSVENPLEREGIEYFISPGFFKDWYNHEYIAIDADGKEKQGSFQCRNLESFLMLLEALSTEGWQYYEA